LDAADHDSCLSGGLHAKGDDPTNPTTTTCRACFPFLQAKTTHGSTGVAAQAGPFLANAQLKAGLRHLQLDGPARRAGGIRMFAHVPETSAASLGLVDPGKLAMHDWRHAGGVRMVASVPRREAQACAASLKLVEALKLAVHDRRRVDELVTLFDYAGSVEAHGQVTLVLTSHV